MKITDAVHVGDQVSVKYTDNGGKLVAMEVDVLQRRPPTLSPPSERDLTFPSRASGFERAPREA